MKLLSIVQILAEATERNLIFSAHSCLHSLDKYSTCERCYDVCPAGAIEPDKPPAFDASACQFCRACLTTCPAGAFNYTGLDCVNSLLKTDQTSNTGDIELLCDINPYFEKGSPGSSAGIRVSGCLAGIGVGGYLALVKHGWEPITVRTDACHTCPWRSLYPQVVDQVEQANRLLASWGRPASLTYAAPNGNDGLQKRPFWNAESPPRSRRAFFGRDLGTSDGEPGESSEPGESGGQYRFRERLRLLRAVKELSGTGAGDYLSTSLEGLGFAVITASEECTACGTCARACPTGALEIDISSTSFSLRFNPEACIGCDICDHVCAPKAISINHSPVFGQVFEASGANVLRQGDVVRCDRCGTPFAHRFGIDLCPTCDFRRKNPFGSMMPPGIPVKPRN